MISDKNLSQHLDDILEKCIKCGLCLPVCPTYSLTLDERSSPRGRIQLMHAVHHGKMGISKIFVNEMYFCLDCQACETACPAGVHYGELVENARDFISSQRKDSTGFKILKNILLKYILSSRSTTKLTARMFEFYERIGLREAVEKSGILTLFSDALNEKHAMIPHFDKIFFDDQYPERITPESELRGRVAFLTGCIMNVTMSDIHRDVLEVLLKNGYEVIIPHDQVCCGSLHAHNGELENAKILAKKNIEIFEKYEYDAIIVDSAGCSAFMKEYGKVLKDDRIYGDRAMEFSLKVKEITEFLAEKRFKTPITPVNLKVTYHEACHLVHTQKISLQPRQLLESIPGIELVEMNEATWCCASAGIYNVVRYEESMKILDRKMKNIQETGANVVATCNPGCHLQIIYGIKKRKLNMEVLHPVSLLARAYKNDLS